MEVYMDKFIWGYFLDVIKVALLNRIFFDLKIKSGRKRIFAVCMVLLCSIIFTIMKVKWQENRYFFFLYMFQYGVLFCILFQGNARESLVFSYVMFMIESMLDGVYSQIFVALNITGRLQKGLAVSSTVLTIMVLGYILGKKELYKKKQKVGYYIGIGIILLVDSVVLSFFQDILQRELQWKNGPWLRLTFVFIALGMVVQIIVILYLLMSRNIYRERNLYHQKYEKMQSAYYESLQLQERELRKYKHDMRYHFSMMQQLFAEDAQKGQNYMEQIVGKYEALPRNIHTGNDIVDILINQFSQVMVEKQITFQVSGKFPEQCRIEQMDLVTLLSNVLGNAMEAAQYARDRKITLNIRYSDSEIYLEESNSYSEYTAPKGWALTWKKDKKNHGLGMEIINDSVKKYHGRIETFKDEKQFQLLIMIKNCTDSE